MITIEARRIKVKGVVQGVGFRPFIYQLARANSLTGWVCNTSGNVTIVIEGEIDNLERFLDEMQSNPPPNSHIESVSTLEELPQGYSNFEIRQSLIEENQYQLISPDLATCPDCQSEIFDPLNRRFHYPFTNCTHCGPRFTIIEDMPYDRPRTTMREFPMCPLCQKEYNNPSDRRFHAQPNACPVCGPKLELTDSSGKIINVPDVILKACQLIKDGRILAIKGLGGYLLTCDATNDQAVTLLRERKRRPAKPLAVMFKNLAEIKPLCRVNRKEAEALCSPASPIVLLKVEDWGNISQAVAPGLKYLGIMLPYTPLHHLLIAEYGGPLVMTSGNHSEEPIAGDNAEAVANLHGIADYFIHHNRKIHSRYDDSVIMIEQDQVQMIRRARGFAPYPVHLPFPTRPVLACGPELKNTFCLSNENHAFVSQHIGDMDNLSTLEHFETTLHLYEQIFKIQPEALACDLHPDYLTTQWTEKAAVKRNLPLISVQHHHAHVVSCMVDNGVQEPVIGVAFDGTGYGTDGKIWGSEFMVADYKGFQRKAHLEYLPLPGGDAAVRKPVRIAAGYLFSLLGNKGLNHDWPGLMDLDEYEIDMIQKQIKLDLNTPWTSSSGRLFDAVSSLLGIRQQVDYEGQAAIELEMAANEGLTEGVYPYHIQDVDNVKIIRLEKLLSAIINDLRHSQPVNRIAALFHNTIADIISHVCLQLHQETGIKLVALSGGVFQNRRLLNQAVGLLKSNGLIPLVQHQVPCNDGGVSLGQAVIANFKQVEI